jgi:tryptophan synthase beta chain
VLEGIIPALESSHAIAWALANPPEHDDPLELICLSGRGDKDLAEVLELLGVSEAVKPGHGRPARSQAPSG